MGLKGMITVVAGGWNGGNQVTSGVAVAVLVGRMCDCAGWLARGMRYARQVDGPLAEDEELHRTFMLRLATFKSAAAVNAICETPTNAGKNRRR